MEEDLEGQEWTKWHIRLPRRLADEVAELAIAERRGTLQQAVLLLENAVRQAQARARRAEDGITRSA